TEMVLRRVEYWIDEDRGAQIKLDKQERNAQKWRKRQVKGAIFSLISFGIANVFLAYLIGSDVVLEFITHSSCDHLRTSIALLLFTAVFYFVFVWFREQVCVIACPCGRLQGVLLDGKSIVVAYDYKRGEKQNGRAKFKKNVNREVEGVGD